MAQLILAATTAAALAPHAAEVVNLATTVSQAVSVFTKTLKTARDRHHEAQDIGFQTWMRKAEERTRIYYEQGPSGPVSWVFTHGTEIPQNALVCGEDIDGSPLYVCRTFHRGGVHFGKAGRGFKTGAMFGYDCKEIEIEFYEVLVAEEYAVRWETATYPFIVRKYGGGTLVEGGHEHDGSPLFIARAFYWGGTHPGKTSSVLKGADITFAGKEYCLKDYQVLVLSDPGSDLDMVDDSKVLDSNRGEFDTDSDPSPVTQPRSATIEQWEDADAQLVKAVARFSETSASLERQFTTRDESTYNLATRIDSSLHYLQKSMQKQIRSSKLALAKTRNRTARSILAIPGEVLSEIFLCFVYDPIHEEAASSLSISMERRVSIIYRRLYSLMGVCVSWRDVCLTCEALWSVVPLIDPGISLVKPLSTDLSLQRARGKGLYLAVFLPNNPHSRLEAMLGDLSRFTAINLHQKNHYSTESTPFIDLLAKILKSVEIKQLSQLSLGGISVVFGGGRGYTRPGPLLFPRPPLSGIEARFLRILRSLSALQLQGVVLDWKHMTFSNSLSTLRISGTSLGESGINLLISALSSASKLRNLELIAIRTLVINENKTQTQQLVFPELQSLYLGDLNFNVLRLLVEVIASGTYHLTLELTQALSTSYWSLSSGPSFYNSQSHHANEVHDILEIAPVNKLVLTGEEDCLWGDSSELQNLLRYTPRINTLILNGFRLDYATLRALRPIPRPRGWGPPGFPKLQTLEFHHAKLPGPLVYLKSGFEDLLDRQQIQRMVIGMRAHDSEYSACSVGEDEEFIHWLKTKVTKFYLSSEEVSDDMIDSDTWQLWNV